MISIIYIIFLISIQYNKVFINYNKNNFPINYTNCLIFLKLKFSKYLYFYIVIHFYYC